MNEDSLWRRFVTWWSDRWPKMCTAFGTVGVAAGGVLASGDSSAATGWIVFIVSALLTVGGQVADWRRTPRQTELQRKVASLEDIVQTSRNDYFQLFQNQLAVLANDLLKLSDKDRVSVYKHDGQAFVMLGRYSKNPEFCKTGRGTYPEGEGCIARAWQHGEASVDDLPDPMTHEDDYYARLKSDWNIKKGTARSFKMKSRSYVAIALEDHASKRIAVIVFESINAGVLDKCALGRSLSNGESKRLVDFMTSMSKYEPTPSYAKKEGF